MNAKKKTNQMRIRMNFINAMIAIVIYAHYAKKSIIKNIIYIIMIKQIIFAKNIILHLTNIVKIASIIYAMHVKKNIKIMKSFHMKK
jgi:hypothetical protein